MKPIIIDNLLPEGYIDAIEQDVSQPGFNWYCIKDCTSPVYGSNTGFVHPAFDIGMEPTHFYPFIKPLVYSIEQAYGQRMQELYRIRIGLLLPAANHKGHNEPHIDFQWPHMTACFYVNDTDGDTVIFKQQERSTKYDILESVAPKRNRVVIFDGSHYHASTKPKDHETRIVITVNFK